VGLSIQACSSTQEFLAQPKNIDSGTYVSAIDRREIIAGPDIFGYVLVDVVPRDLSAAVYIDNAFLSTIDQARKGIRVTAATDHSLEIRTVGKSCKFLVRAAPRELQTISCRLDNSE
jgi:hypothetical protein